MLDGHSELTTAFGAIKSSKQDVLRLAEAIGDLSEGERLVFTLCDYEELNVMEIALVIGEPQVVVLQLHDSAVYRLMARLVDQK
jgi:DNA-directed RNA polymerase specialized sigma subunit